MAIQLSVEARNARLDSLETAVGATPTIEIRTGAAPASCAAADSGTLLAEVEMPSDWMAAASGGSKAMTGTWPEVEAVAAGTAGHFRLKDSGGDCHLQGTVTATGGGGDMTVSNTSFAVDQPFEITGFTLTDGNA